MISSPDRGNPIRDGGDAASGSPSAPGSNSASGTPTAAAAGNRMLEDGAFTPSPQELERLLFALEASLQITKRFHFFLWVQGVLQSFLPYQTMIVAWGKLEAGQFEVDVFSSDAVSEDKQAELLEGSRDTVAAAMAEWSRRGREPLVWDLETQSANPDDPLTTAIWELGLGNTLIHGTREFRGSGSSMFIFGRMSRPPRRRSKDVCTLLLPHLHFALHRFAISEAGEGANRRGRVADLSAREIEIMRGVREGKTNLEIAVALGISPLTVKNHVQRILRKLEVSNRAQAVARCIAGDLFN